ncbi:MULTISPECIES: cation-translocating P-type ATPase [unclassified Haloarcula]|uniref:heavy metal translocating P-type ATPase n=1 Tax=unclassified Haloarcula TaxID=2624677 RepID=UPI000EF1E6B8|nr:MULTISPECIES: cation-translocating P-type ATPase [unclassified Haloarcula]RLM33786.1 cation-transporting P-type ATPase [Haloarcula sp. Atlit-120R]RLM42656.1 cation-transporting P-type ATPase [Haloarcula sp. Atlit-47R]
MTHCTLCDLPVDTPVTDDAVEGTFCCRGCLEVARTLDDPATETRDAADTGPDPDDADGETAFLSVDGMHCATCETFLEARATDHDGIVAAAASYPTGTMKLTYDADALTESDLTDAVAGTGYGASLQATETDDEYELEGRLIVGGFFGMMTMLWYILFLYPAYLGVDSSLLLFDPSGQAGAYLLWNMAVMTGVVVGYTGWPLLRGAYVSLRAGRPNMDLLVAMAAVTAFLYSVVAVILGHTEVYFDVATVIVMAVSVGDYYQDRVRRRALDRLTEFTTQRADSARRRADGDHEEVAVSDLDPGDEVVVRSGERVPVDGTVVEGTAAVDESLVTGESLAVRKTAGDEVIGGSLVTQGGVVARVGPDAESTVDRLTNLLWEVQSTRGGVQRLVDRIAAVFVPLVVVLAVLATGGHLVTGATLTDAMLTGLAVLVVSCPCALGLATPLATAAGIRRALDGGTVVTGDAVFETATDADVVAFDKTGTLTTGEMELLERADDRAMARAAAVEQFADHPVAEAVTDAVPVPDAAVSEFEQHPGQGVSATVDGDRVVVGTRALLEDLGFEVPSGLRSRCERATENGRVPALVGWDGTARDVLVAGDRLRANWESVVSTLARDRDVVVITGDRPEAAAPFDRHDGVDEVFAGVPPEAKAEVVERLQSRGTVAMVGDGSNDAPALAAADVGIAMASGTSLAADAADAVVTTDDLRAVPDVFAVTAATRTRVRQNLAWAFCYNAVALPLALLGVLNPLFAALAMTASSLLVVGNSTRTLAGTASHGEANADEPAAPKQPAAAD